MRLRLSPALILVALWLAAGSERPLQADTGGTGGTTGTGSSTALVASDFIYEFRYKESRTDKEWETIADNDLVKFFNRARCECDTPLQIRVRLAASARGKLATPKPGTIKIGMGDPSCICGSTEGCQGRRCTEIPDVKSLGALSNAGVLAFETTVQKLFAAGETSTEPTVVCRRRGKESIYLLIDGDDSGEYPDLTDATKEMELDGEPPRIPDGLKVLSGNQALEVRWDAVPVSEVDDLQGYAVFCARGGELPPFEGVFDQEHTPAACKATTATATAEGKAVVQALQDPGDAGATDAAGGQSADASDARSSDARDAGDAADLGGSEPPDVEEINAPLAIQQLDPRFLCSDLITSSTSTRITGLENHIPYAVAVASVDRRGNASLLATAIVGRPKPTRDFFGNYRKEGGKATGGFCNVGGADSAAAGAWLLLLVVTLTGLARPGRRR